MPSYLHAEDTTAAYCRKATSVMWLCVKMDEYKHRNPLSAGGKETCAACDEDQEKAIGLVKKLKPGKYWLAFVSFFTFATGTTALISALWRAQPNNLLIPS